MGTKATNKGAGCAGAWPVPGDCGSGPTFAAPATPAVVPSRLHNYTPHNADGSVNCPGCQAVLHTEQAVTDHYAAHPACLDAACKAMFEERFVNAVDHTPKLKEPIK